MTATDSRPAIQGAEPRYLSPAGTDSLSGQSRIDAQTGAAAEGQASRQSPTATRPANLPPVPKDAAPAGLDSLSGHVPDVTHELIAAEGDASPRAIAPSTPKAGTPAGTMTAPPARGTPAPKVRPLEGHKTSHGHSCTDAHTGSAVADDIPGGQGTDGTHTRTAAGDSDPGTPAAKRVTAPTAEPPLAYPLLAVAADVFDDTEKTRTSNENRLRQLTRSQEDKDGKKRGFGLDARHPGVARLIALISAMKCDSTVVRELAGEKVPMKAGCCLEHDAERNLVRLLRDIPVAAWAASITGCGEKQFARLLGAAGDPYMRAPVYADDGTLVPGTGQPRTLSQWRAYCGHGDPRRKPFKGMTQADAFRLGNREAKMRAHLIAEKFIQFTGSPDKNGNPTPHSPYRDIYDSARICYADRVHEGECRNSSRLSPNGCGTRDHPEWGEPGSPWRDGHQLAAAVHLVAKCFLADLYAEAKRIHEGA